MMRETNYGTNRSNHSTSTVNRGSGAYDKVYEPPSSGYNTTHSTNYTTIKNLPSSDYNSGHNSGHSTVKTIYTTGATPPPAPVLNPDRIFNAGNSDNVFTSMRYEKGPRDITTISSTVHLQPGENPQKKLDEIYKSLMQIR
ncbi:unnamed protein product, partial [Mesorhabditis belari]|uniref:Uncharacterized protein n=1 Tax=Mesorhabditis belari TaxID=2138241 RepID=A0AAF3EV64_9BILA